MPSTHLNTLTMVDHVYVMASASIGTPSCWRMYDSFIH